MKAVINFQLLEDIHAYEFVPSNEFQIRDRFKNVTFFDLDQLSDHRLFEHARLLINEADTILLIVSGERNEKSYNLHGLAEASMKRKDSFFVLNTVDDKRIDRYFGPLGNNYLAGKDPSVNDSFIINALSDQT